METLLRQRSHRQGTIPHLFGLKAPKFPQDVSPFPCAFPGIHRVGDWTSARYKKVSHWLSEHKPSLLESVLRAILDTVTGACVREVPGCLSSRGEHSEGDDFA